MRDCPACGSNEMALWRKIAGTYDVYECALCQMMYADNIPSAEEINAYYQDQAKKFNYFKKGNPTWYTRIHSECAKWINDHFDLWQKDVVDVGCGEGSFMLHLMKYPLRNISGYDPSKEGVNLALSKGLSAYIANSCAEMFRKKDCNETDLMTLVHVLEHIRDTDVFIADLSACIAPGGMIFIEVPDAEKFILTDNHELMFDQWQPLLQFSTEHINFFTKDSLVALMRRAGFDCEVVEKCSSGVMVIRGLFKKRKSLRSVFDTYYNGSVRKLQAMVDKLPHGEQLYGFGAGGLADAIFNNCDVSGLNIIAFIDNNPNLVGKKFHGIPVIMPHQIDKVRRTVIFTFKFIDDIVAQLQSTAPDIKVIRL